ncbi:hypothetical protein TNCV_2675221 [Trichonephila clavipes]|nr:hypothetical protein TNCV_2675221 [Trichonephila clavipes]
MNSGPKNPKDLLKKRRIRRHKSYIQSTFMPPASSRDPQNRSSACPFQTSLSGTPAKRELTHLQSPSTLYFFRRNPQELTPWTSDIQPAARI